MRRTSQHHGRSGELAEMRALLKEHGYPTSAAARLAAEGIGPYELEHRIRTTRPGAMGSLEYTHGLVRTRTSQHRGVPVFTIKNDGKGKGTHRGAYPFGLYRRGECLGHYKTRWEANYAAQRHVKAPRPRKGTAERATWSRRLVRRGHGYAKGRRQ